MLLKVIIISIVLVAFVVLALGIKLLFDPDAEFTVHSCSLEEGKSSEDGSCLKCQLQDFANCPEKMDTRKLNYHKS
jgi:hypothetical protein